MRFFEMQKKKRKKRTASEIRCLVDELNSDLSVAKLAIREGVTVGAVYQWKKRVGVKQIEPVELVMPTDVCAPLGVGSSGVSIEMNSIKCTVEPGFDRETLGAVLEVISHSAGGKGNASC